MGNTLIGYLKKDCAKYGYGRKKWWADQLGVPPLTVSHWLAGRQCPNGRSALLLQELLGQAENDRNGKLWKDYLWDSYYLGERPPRRILPVIILEILSLSSLDSRTLALLSCVVENESPAFEEPTSNKLKNRLGWLLEVSGRKAPFGPVRALTSQPFLQISLKNQQLGKYLRRYRSSAGKKWRIFDCPLSELKQSLKCLPNENKS